MAFAPVFQRPFSATFSRAAAGNGLLNALIAYWPLNEAGGANNALDLHSNGLTLTQVSSPGADTGKVYSTARTFDGSADYFTRNSETLLQTGNVDWSIAFWVFATSLANSPMLVTKITGGAYEYAVYPEPTGQLGYYVWNGATTVAINCVTGAGVITTGAWKHVIAWYDSVAGTGSVSVDNAAPVTAGKTTNPGTSSANFRLASWQLAAGNRLAGRIGPVAMWKSAAGGGGVLTAAQRTALYNGGAGLPYASFTA